jgi:hypothetical protein
MIIHEGVTFNSLEKNLTISVPEFSVYHVTCCPTTSMKKGAGKAAPFYDQVWM